eukprot:1958102-Rhodomonas_salina.3
MAGTELVYGGTAGAASEPFLAEARGVCAGSQTAGFARDSLPCLDCPAKSQPNSHTPRSEIVMASFEALAPSWFHDDHRSAPPAHAHTVPDPDHNHRVHAKATVSVHATTNISIHVRSPKLYKTAVTEAARMRILALTKFRLLWDTETYVNPQISVHMDACVRAASPASIHTRRMRCNALTRAIVSRPALLASEADE